MRRLMLEELLWSCRHNKLYASKHLTRLALSAIHSFWSRHSLAVLLTLFATPSALPACGSQTLQRTPLRLLPGTSSTNTTCARCAVLLRIALSTRSSWSAAANPGPIVALPTPESTNRAAQLHSFSNCVFSLPSIPSAQIPASRLLCTKSQMTPVKLARSRKRTEAFLLPWQSV